MDCVQTVDHNEYGTLLIDVTAELLPTLEKKPVFGLSLHWLIESSCTQGSLRAKYYEIAVDLKVAESREE